VKRFTIPVLVAMMCVALGAAHSAAAPKPASSSAAKGASKSGDKTAVVDSLDLLQRAVARDSSKWDNLYRLGLMLIDHDRPQEAQRVLLKATQVRPGNVPTLVNLGAAYDALGQAANAQRSYHDALQIAPDDTVATCRLASSLYSTGDFSNAVDLLRTLIAKNPTAYCAYFTLGVAFADAGIYKDAIRMWEKVVALAPTSPEAMSAKESIDVLQRVIQTTQGPEATPSK
jgi:tetratricopeptide (TPR) repeat protein